MCALRRSTIDLSSGIVTAFVDTAWIRIEAPSSLARLARLRLLPYEVRDGAWLTRDWEATGGDSSELHLAYRAD